MSKPNGTSTALLTPAAHGWRLRLTPGSGEDQTMPTLDEALANIPAHTHLELALPCHSVLIERHALPSTDRTELADMLQLQLEKTLPFAVEEVSHGFEVVRQGENESTVLAVAAPHAELDQLCAPLRDKGRLPEKVTLHALEVATASPEGQTVLALWPEQEQLVAGIISDRKLAWAQTISSLSPQAVMAELPGLLIGAELEGVSTEFGSIRLATGDACSELAEPLYAHFKKPVEPLAEPSSGKLSSEVMDLLPAAWQLEARGRERTEKLKQNLLICAVAYLVLIAGGFIYLAMFKRKVLQTQAEVVKMEPRYAGIIKQEARWDALAASIEPERFAARVLNHVTRLWRSNAEKHPDGLQFTSFTYSPREWIVKGEGSSDAWFDFTQALKKDEKLETFEISVPPYTNIKDGERVSFNITGKPR